MERLLDKRALAGVLGVSVKTVDKWVSERRIPFVRITGKCVRFLPGAVLTYLEKATIYPSDEVPVKPKRRKRS
jgi:excisionase family DNA binding protein